MGGLDTCTDTKLSEREVAGPRAMTFRGSFLPPIRNLIGAKRSKLAGSLEVPTRDLKRTTPLRPNILARRHWFTHQALKIPSADWLSLARGVPRFQKKAWLARAESRRCTKDGLPFAAGLRSREKLHSTRYAPSVV
jgi:hypothetical protein